MTATIFHYFLVIGGFAGIVSGISMSDDPKDKDGIWMFALFGGIFMLFLACQ